MLGKPAAIGGYRVYRRVLAEEEYGAPLNADAGHGHRLRGRDRALRVPLVYTVRAVARGNPKVEGLPAEELPVSSPTSIRRRRPRAWTRSPREPRAPIWDPGRRAGSRGLSGVPLGGRAARRCA